MVQRNCTTLQYSILIDPESEIESLTIEIKPSLSLRESHLKFNKQELKNNPAYAHLFDTFSIKLNIADCPIGFKLDHGEGTCVCQPELLSSDLKCNSTDYKFIEVQSSGLE